jgi:DNA invertase Pin-like site-specific DNA recombinase
MPLGAMTTRLKSTDVRAFDLHVVCRLSTQEAADGESLEAQVAQARRDAAVILEVPEADIVFVRGAGTGAMAPAGRKIVKISACHISGGTQWEERQDLQDVLQDARAHRCRAVQTPNLDRVARNVEVAERFRRELLANGVRTLYEGRTPYDLADDNQQLLYGMRAQFSAWERGIITKRNYSGHLRATREGFYVGGNIPFGTRLEPTGLRSRNRRFRMVVDEAEMRVVHELFTRRRDGWTPRQLSAWSKDTRVQPNPSHYRSPGPGLGKGHIQRILANQFYVTGRFTFTVSAPRWPAEVIEQQIDLPSPIPAALFEEVAAIRARRVGHRQPKGVFLLSELVYHRESGTPFISAPVRSRWFYYRNDAWGQARRALYRARRLTRAQLTPAGGNYPVFASVYKAQLERLVIQELVKIRDHPGLVDQLLAAEHGHRASSRALANDAYFKKQAEINEAQAAVERFLEAFASGVLPMSAPTTRKHQQLSDRVSRLEREALELRAQRAPRAPSDRAARLKAALARLPEVLEAGAPEERAGLVRTIVHRVWIDNAGAVSIDLALAESGWISGSGEVRTWMPATT